MPESHSKDHNRSWRSQASGTQKAAGGRSTRRSRSPLPSLSSKTKTSRPSLPHGSESMASSSRASQNPKMDAELVDLGSTRPAVLMAYLEHVGVESFSDLRGIWSSSMDLVGEVEAFVGSTLLADDAMKIATFWALASQRAHAGHQKLVDSLVAERSSSYRRPVHLTENQQQAPVQQSRIRRLIASGTPGPPPTTVQLAARDAHSREEAQKQTKLNTIFEIAIEDVVNLEDLGVSWTSLEDPMTLQATKDTMLAGATRLGVGRLGALVAAFRRWKRYAEEQGIDVKQPAPIHVGAFLQKVAQGGPTAAASQFQAMLWWQRALGAGFPMQHWLVAPWRLHASNHQGKQACELPPWEMMNLLRWAAKLHGTNQLLVSFMVMAAVSCVRWEHIQRSHYVRSHSGWIECYCRQGKTRRQGARPGYSWAIPEISWQGYSLCAVLSDFFKNMAISEDFIGPAVELQPEDLWEICSSTPLVLDKPMSRSRFLELFRGALMQINVEPVSASKAQYNRLRRFLPTGGNVFQLQPLDQQAIGNWTEIPDGGGREGGSRKLQAVVHMGLHYAGEKLYRSYVVKAHVLRVMLTLFRRRQGDFATDENNMLVRGAWEWPELAAFFDVHKEEFHTVQASVLDQAALPIHSSDQIEVDADGDHDVRFLDELPPDEPLPGPDPVEPSTDAIQPEEDSVSISSLSASDASADGADLVNIVTDEQDVINTRWILQGSRMHIIRENDDDGHGIPWCRDRRFAQPPKSEGMGFSTLSHDKTCQRCISRMPRGLVAALADFAGWQY